MAYTVSPNMQLTIPNVGTEPGPQYSFDVNTALSLVDSHDHTPGKGVQITPAGLNINATLSFNDNMLSNVMAVVFQPQVSFSLAPALYVSPGSEPSPGPYNDLWYNDGINPPIQIVSNGAVNVVASSIPGESYAGGTFTWRQGAGSSTPANFDIGSVTIRPNTASTTAGVTLNAATTGTYPINFQAALPPAQAFVTLDNLGNIGTSIPTTNGITASNIANGTITAAQISPTAGITSNQLAASVFEWQSQTFTNTTPSFSVLVATTSPGTLATSFANGSVIDGVTLATGNIILIKNQTNSPDDGVYVVNASGNPTRSTSYNTFTQLNYAGVTVTSGTVNAGTSWFQNNVLTSLADAQSWSQSETAQFVVPASANTLFIVGVGGGGGGGGGASGTSGLGGGGGGGGAGATPFFNVLSVTPGDTLAITSGFGGPGGAINAAGSNGQTSSILYSGNVVAYYPGATGGVKGTTDGTSSAVVNTFTNSLFAGIATTGGSGGGGSSDSQAGKPGTIGGVNNYVGTSAATGAVGSAFGGLAPSGSGGGGGAGLGMGGAGGNGYSASTTGSVGSPGSNYGAGGGGGGGGQGVTILPAKTGGNGANGAVILYWLG